MSYSNYKFNSEYYTNNTELNNRIDEIILFRDYINQILDDIKLGSYDVEIINKIAQYGEKIINKQTKFNPRVIISNDSSDSDNTDTSDIEIESDVEILTVKANNKETESNVSSLSYHKYITGYSNNKPNTDYYKSYFDEKENENDYYSNKNKFDDLYDKYDKYEKYDSLVNFYDGTNNFEEKKTNYQTQNYLAQNYPKYNYGTNSYSDNYQINNNVETQNISNTTTNTDTNPSSTKPPPVSPKADTLATNFVKNTIEIDKYNYLKSFNLDRINKFCQNCMSY